ncbi:hypothetical protein BgAZ_205000 [Babesia gibsoni]|uniref:Rad60/SUMO-like domain-containing protein n=1 Tax=Babesia gibsoni TaxID=33632 RepID=A0AAD8LJY4_BABGI|nr:hypothetical protein BgAZ_205000 [Babesia gibsoni]
MISDDDKDTENIFSEDVKDSSMFRLVSSDEDCVYPDEFETTPSQRFKDVKHGLGAIDAILSDKVDLESIKDGDLYEQVHGTTAMLSEINKFFEESVASLVREELKEDSSCAVEDVDLSGIEDTIDLDDDGDVVIVTRSRVRTNREFVPASSLSKDKPTRIIKPRNNRNNEDSSSYSVSDDDYIPDSYVQLRQKGKSQRHRRTSKREASAKGGKKISEHFKPFEQADNETEEYTIGSLKKGKNKGLKSKTKDIIDDDIELIQECDMNLETGAPGDNYDYAPNEYESTYISDLKNQHTAADEEHSESICLKFVIMDENRCMIKDDRLQSVYVKRDETMGNLAEKFGRLFNLEDTLFKDIAIYVDGDQQPHNITIDDENLGLEEGMQVDIIFPPKNQKIQQPSDTMSEADRKIMLATLNIPMPLEDERAYENRMPSESEIIEID